VKSEKRKVEGGRWKVEGEKRKVDRFSIPFNFSTLLTLYYIADAWPCPEGKR
jgi:hypothetical protein